MRPLTLAEIRAYRDLARAAKRLRDAQRQAERVRKRREVLRAR
jgi:hypothetical protein